MSASARAMLWPTVAAVLVLALTLAAGNWQWHRAQYKRELQARIDALSRLPAVTLTGREAAASLDGRRVRVTGRFDVAHEIFIDNRSWEGRPAYQVLTPLRIEGSDVAVLVDRGLVERQWKASSPPLVPVPEAPVTIEGIAGPPPGKYLELSAQVVEGKVWQNLDLPRYAQTVPYPLLPLVVTQLNDTGDGLHRRWLRPDLGVEKHLGYAFQWFAMAAATVIIYGVMYARRKRPRRPE